MRPERILKGFFVILWKLICFIFKVFYTFYLTIYRKPNYEIYGSSRFSTEQEKAQIISPNNIGLSLGNVSLTISDSRKNSIIICPSGGGKTTCYVIPTILRANPIHKISYIVLDPSQEIYDITADIMKKNGFIIKSINLVNIYDSDIYNVFIRLRNENDVLHIVDLIVDSGEGYINNDSSYWTNGAKSIIKILIISMLEENPVTASFTKLKDLILKISTAPKEVDEYLEKNLSNKPHILNEFIFIQQQPEKVLSGWLSTAKQAMLRIDSNIEYITKGEDTLQFELLREKPVILYLRIPETRIGFYSYFISILYYQVFDMLLSSGIQEDKNDITFILEEFANSITIKNFPILISQVRKYKIHLVIILQSFSQLASKFSANEASTIFENCYNKIFFGNLPLETANLVEQMAGQQARFVDNNFFRKFKTFYKKDRPQETSLPLISAFEVMHLPKNNIVFFNGSNYPIVHKVVPYYEDKELMDKLKRAE